MCVCVWGGSAWCLTYKGKYVKKIYLLFITYKN